MADESCAFPGESGEVPRSPGRWLDRATAERLLDGAPLEDLDLGPAAFDAGVADEAAHLAQALKALRALGAPGRATNAFGRSAEVGPAEVWSVGVGSAVTGARSDGLGPAQGELPGEAAALTAFRQARDGGWVGDEPSIRNLRGARSRARSGYDGARAAAATTSVPGAAMEIAAVRLGGPGDGGSSDGSGHTGATRADHAPRRPVRFGLVAVLASCMLGGVTVAAATAGILPSPFGHHRPSPTVSVPAGTPDHPRLSPSPGVSGDTTGTHHPSGTPDQDDEANGSDRSAPPDSRQHDGSSSSEKWWARMTSACQDYRGGKDLDPATERELEDAAHGSGQVESFCAGVLRDDGAKDSNGQNTPDATHGTTDDNTATSENNGGGDDGEHGQGDANGDGNGQGDGRNGTEDDDEGTEGSGSNASGSSVSSVPSTTDTTTEPPVTPEADAGVTFSETLTQ